MKWTSWLNLITGAWLMLAPGVLYFGSGIATANAITFGVVTVLVAIWSLASARAIHAPAGINLAIGVWMFISPWTLGYSVSGPALWNAEIVGGLMVIFSAMRMTDRGLPDRSQHGIGA
jgi:hypothetical protein